MKVVNIADVVHPISLYIYDAPGDLADIKEDAVIFPTIDIIFIVVDGDNEEHCNSKVIGTYNKYATENLAKYSQRAAQMLALQGAEHSPRKAPNQPSPKRNKLDNEDNEQFLQQEELARKKRELDDSQLTPLHYLSSNVPGIPDFTMMYPKCVYIFTHKDKIESKGIANVESTHLQRLKMMRDGIITKSTYVVSCKAYSDIHLVFKKEIQLKLQADALYKT